MPHRRAHRPPQDWVHGHKQTGGMRPYYHLRWVPATILYKYHKKKNVDVYSS